MAVVSAIAISGVYVGWRQAEADKVNKRERIERAKAEELKKDKDHELMVGSKSSDGRLLTRDELNALRARSDFSNVIPGIPEGGEGVRG